MAQSLRWGLYTVFVERVDLCMLSALFCVLCWHILLGRTSQLQAERMRVTAQRSSMQLREHSDDHTGCVQEL